jgi:two-component system response regulator LytT
MKIVIIEDELLTANDLALTLVQLDAEIIISAVLPSVKSALQYFADHEPPDLIFSDIQLGDGLSFDIFRGNLMNVPVIFCTAYDEYALDAFKANGVDYILKPFTNVSLNQTLQKYKLFRQKFAPKESYSYDKLAELLQKKLHHKKNAILVYQGERIIPLPVAEIALCFVHNKITLIICFDQQNFMVNQSLEELENTCGSEFFRANRQYLVNRTAIKEVSHYYARKLLLKLSINFKDTIKISKERSSSFLEWLATGV